MEDTREFMFVLPNGKAIIKKTTMEAAIDICRRRVRDRIWEQVSLKVLYKDTYIHLGRYSHSAFHLSGKKYAELNEELAVMSEPVLPKKRAY